MFDALLIITLFILTSLLVCLLTLRLSISFKHLFWPHRLLYLTKISDPPVYFDPSASPLPLFIRHLRVRLNKATSQEKFINIIILLLIKKQTKLKSMSCFTLRCASSKYCLQWNWKYLIFVTQNLGYTTYWDKGNENSGAFKKAIKMDTRKWPL